MPARRTGNGKDSLRRIPPSPPFSGQMAIILSLLERLISHRLAMKEKIPPNWDSISILPGAHLVPPVAILEKTAMATSIPKEKEGLFRDWRNIIRRTPSYPKRSPWRPRMPSPGRSKRKSPSFCTCRIMQCTVLSNPIRGLSKITKTRKSQGPRSHLPL